VNRNQPRCTCTCFELQEMVWPCKHVMMWDNLEGKDFTKHFHKCWRSSSLRTLYVVPIPSFLCNNLSLSDSCHPPAIAVRKGRHRVVRIKGSARRSRQEEGIVRDEMGYLCRIYPIDDDPAKLDPMPLPSSVFADLNLPRKEKRTKRNQGPNTGKTKCSKCQGTGHNLRTCKATFPVEEMSAEMHPSSTATAPAIYSGLIYLYVLKYLRRYFSGKIYVTKL
jgi:hypothetical protein